MNTYTTKHHITDNHFAPKRQHNISISADFSPTLYHTKYNIVNARTYTRKEKFILFIPDAYSGRIIDSTSI